jgi:DNA-directed RNA polymerase subunit RPC12/RpoP
MHLLKLGGYFCSGNIRKVIKDYYSLAKTRGFKWIGGQLSSTTAEKTLWECSKGHKWESTYGNIYAGYNCPYCSGKIRKTKEDYHELAKSYGFKWIGDVLPKSNKYSTLWECEEGHVWKARYNNIYNGYGCPYCQDMINGAIVSKPQRKLNSILHGSLNYPEGKRCIDVAIMRNSKKIAVEYDCWYWHQGREEQDAKRDSFLVSRGWKVIHIKSGEMLPIRKQLKKSNK